MIDSNGIYFFVVGLIGLVAFGFICMTVRAMSDIHQIAEIARKSRKGTDK